jgi:hypothetical protein
MKNIFKISILLIVGVLFLGGCGRTASVQNIDNSSYLKKSIKLSKMESAIKIAAEKRGWQATKIKKGLIEARIMPRGKHLVVVNIDYNSKGYKISYKNSKNMNYDPATNSIHPNYNKWVSYLQRNINYELENIGMNHAVNSNYVAKKQKVSKKHIKKGKHLNLNGKTLYIKPMATYSPNSRVSSKIKTECTLPKAISDSIIQFSKNSGVNIKVKNNIRPNELELKIQIEDAVSSGNAFVGHNKFVDISGSIVKGNTVYYTFDAARRSGGGYFGAYRSSCSVLGRIAKALGKDISYWLSNPYDNAKMGDTELIRR